MLIVNRYDPSMRLGEKYSNIVFALPVHEYLVYPNNEIIRWGDGRRSGRPPYSSYEDAYLLCEWKKCEVQEMSVQNDHIHLVVSISPMVSISEMMGILKGKLTIKLFKSYPKIKQKPYWGNHFWARGYFVSTLESMKK